MLIRFKKLYPDAKIPTFGNGDEMNAGIDFYATEQATLAAGESMNFGTGVAWEPPTHESGEYSRGLKPALIIKGRSGLACRAGIEASNAGVIDAGYRGEIIVRLTNMSAGVYTIMPGDRIAQGVVVLLPRITIQEAEELEESERGAAGFGSSGR